MAFFQSNSSHFLCFSISERRRLYYPIRRNFRDETEGQWGQKTCKQIIFLAETVEDRGQNGESTEKTEGREREREKALKPQREKEKSEKERKRRPEQER